jgi:hypothetical protein
VPIRNQVKAQQEDYVAHNWKNCLYGFNIATHLCLYISQEFRNIGILLHIFYNYDIHHYICARFEVLRIFVCVIFFEFFE